ALEQSVTPRLDWNVLKGNRAAKRFRILLCIKMHVLGLRTVQVIDLADVRLRLLPPPLVNWHEPRWCQRSTPTVAAENSVRVLLSHSIRLASESRSKPHPHHPPFSEHSQPISAVVVEHSPTGQMQGATRAPLKVDHSQSD